MGIFFIAGNVETQWAPRLSSYPPLTGRPIRKGADHTISAIEFNAGAETALRLAQESAAEL